MFKIRLYIMIYKNILRKLIIVSPVRWRRRLPSVGTWGWFAIFVCCIYIDNVSTAKILLLCAFLFIPL